MAHGVFISHSSRDKAVADKVCAALEARGIRCWLAHRDVAPGESWVSSIVDAIEGSRVLVLLFTRAANRSPQVLREVAEAVDRRIPILTLRLQSVRPSKELGYYIKAVQWLDGTEPPLEPHLLRLVELVEKLLGPTAGRTARPPAASTAGRDETLAKASAAAAAQGPPPAVEASAIEQPESPPAQSGTAPPQLETVQGLEPAAAALLLPPAVEFGPSELAETHTRQALAQFAEGTIAAPPAPKTDELVHETDTGALAPRKPSPRREARVPPEARGWRHLVANLPVSRAAWAAVLLALALLAGRAWLWPRLPPVFRPSPSATATARSTQAATSLVAQVATGLHTPSATWTAARSSTPWSSATWTVAPTATAMPSATRTPAPTLTALPSATWTLAPTSTSRPSATGTASPSPTTALKAGATKPLGQTGITLVYVPAGEFLMGSPDSGTYEDQKPQHRVYLDAYWIGQTEVTNAQFRQFIDAGGYDNRIYWSDEGWQWLESNRPMKPSGWGDIGWTSPEHPVVGVSWYEAEAFARWAGGRLPTEAEWEYAARGGPLSAGYLYAGGNNPDEVMWYADNSGGTPHPVATKEANELGLYDMSGNAYEWVADWYGKDYYAQSPRQNPTGPSSGPGRVRRGGSWTWDQTSERCASRNWQDPTYKFLDAGFRVAVGISIRQPPDAVVKQDDVELREGPSSVYGVVGTYGQGTELVVLGRSSGKQWLKVSAPDAKLGWMRVEYLQVNVAIDSLEVGSAPPSPTPLPSPTPPGPPAGTTKVLQPSGLVLVWVRGGEFWMGSADTDPDGYPDEKPQHRVYVDGFWIG